jgi:Uma2 family endonuclease
MGIIVINQQFRIPTWVVDLQSFRRWAHSPDYPQRGQFSFIDGDLWADLSMERLAHNLIKSCICTYLTLLVKREGLGSFLGDRMLLTNVAAGLSTEPDGMFLSSAGLEAAKVRLENGEDSLEVIGTPDMVLEVVSATSVDKDTLLLPQTYLKAGIGEYWIVDSRVGAPQLQIFRRGRTRYNLVKSSAGWVTSSVFSKSFRLIRKNGDHDLPEFMLGTK